MFSYFCVVPHVLHTHNFAPVPKGWQSDDTKPIFLGISMLSHFPLHIWQVKAFSDIIILVIFGISIEDEVKHIVNSLNFSMPL